MCLAVPGKILSITPEGAEVDFTGTRRKVSLQLVPEAKKGDYVLVHAGFAIELLDPEDAAKTLEVFKEIYSREDLR